MVWWCNRCFLGPNVFPFTTITSSDSSKIKMMRFVIHYQLPRVCYQESGDGNLIELVIKLMQKLQKSVLM